MTVSIAKLKKGGQVRTAVILRMWRILSSIGQEVALDIIQEEIDILWGM
jgi:hypothetical protein